MPVTERHRNAESRFRSLLEEAELPPPDDVSYEPEELVFFWDEPKVAVVVELYDAPVEDLVARATELVASHPAVDVVEFAGSRSRGTHEELSDWDVAVRTADFHAVARDMPELVAPLEPLAEQWEPMGHFVGSPLDLEEGRGDP